MRKGNRVVIMVVGIGYHYVRPDFEQPYPGFFGVTNEEFRTQLQLLARYGEFVGLNDIRRSLTEGYVLPEKAWLVTFDDGLREQYEQALPILDELGIPAVLFTPTKPLVDGKLLNVHMIHTLRSLVDPAVLSKEVYLICDQHGFEVGEVAREKATTQYFYDTPEVAEIKYLLNFALPAEVRVPVTRECFKRLVDEDEKVLCDSLYMDRKQLKDLADRDFLGTHAHAHMPLGTLKPEEIEHDIAQSNELLKTWTGKNMDAIAYPYGSKAACTPRVGEIAKQLGLDMGFTMERAVFDKHVDPMFIPRCAPNDLPGGSSPRWSFETGFEQVPVSTWYS